MSRRACSPFRRSRATTGAGPLRWVSSAQIKAVDSALLAVIENGSRSGKQQTIELCNLRDRLNEASGRRRAKRAAGTR